ncbi:MAG: hypothetical protein DRP79_02695 [Planctomycetota bacterium]|nr:MAG: hypothetical protein DRP79_02695 [Planctomycetota bacterium]
MRPIKGSQTLAFIFLIVSCLGGAFSSACARDVFENPFGDTSGENEDIKISIHLSSETIDPGDIFGVVLDFELAEGFHLYKDNLEFNWSKLTGAEKAGVIYPTAKLFQNPDGPGTVDAFEGKFTVIPLFRATAEKGGSIEIRGRVDYQACSDVCLSGGKDIYYALKAGSRGEAAVWEAPPGTFNPEGEGVESLDGEETPWSWFHVVIAFAAGVGLSLTPCVLPMVPVTSGIIRGYARPGKLSAFISSLIYALGISLVYGVIGAAVAFVGVQVQSVLNAPYVRIPIAGLLVFLALGMFGVVRIQMPSSIQAKAQQAGSKTGKNKLGLFLLGMAGGLVVGPCVAPALTGLFALVVNSGSVILGFLTMFACGLGICVLLVLSGTFTGLIPRSGAWMVLVEHAFGFALLWAALYFASYLMPPGVYYLCMAVLFSAAAAYFALSAAIGRVKYAFAVLCLVVGLGFGAGGGYLMGRPGTAAGGPEQVRAALASGRPVVVDFSAPWCSACARLDGSTFSNPAVAKELERFEFIKINVDDHGAFASEYGVKGIPDVRIFDSDGKERKDLNFTGFKDADNVLARLKRVK